MTEHAVAEEGEIGEGGRLLVDIGGKEIAVFRIDGEYRAYLNWCPHQAGPVCEGGVTGRMTADFDRDTLEYEFEWTDDSTLVCPWHDWEFDVRSGDCFSRGGVSLPSYPVRVSGGEVLVSVD